VDPNPQLDLSVEAQKWYRAEGLPTKVKACATTGLDEILMLAGVDAQTLMPADLHGLQSRNRSETDIAAMSLFKATADTRMADVKYPSYIDNEEKYRMDFGYADEGNAQRKLGQVSEGLSGRNVLVDSSGLVADMRVKRRRFTFSATSRPKRRRWFGMHKQASQRTPAEKVLQYGLSPLLSLRFCFVRRLSNNITCLLWLLIAYVEGPSSGMSSKTRFV
jgi:hypothetical protein